MFGSIVETHGKHRPEFSTFHRVHIANYAITKRCVSLSRANSPVCYRSGVQLNVVKAFINRHFFSVIRRIIRSLIIGHYRPLLNSSSLQNITEFLSFPTINNPCVCKTEDV
jgi:hypothetical protein